VLTNPKAFGIWVIGASDSTVNLINSFADFDGVYVYSNGNKGEGMRKPFLTKLTHKLTETDM
jgi:hypothetical protein